MLLGLHHVAMATENLERLSAFYRDMFGMTVLTEGEWDDDPAIDAIVGLPHSAARFRLLGAGNLAIELFEYQRPRSLREAGYRPVSKPGLTHICFAVRDIDAEHARLCAAGVRFHAPPPPKAQADAEEQIYRAVYGRDIDGNVFELMEIAGDTPFDYAPQPARWR